MYIATQKTYLVLGIIVCLLSVLVIAPKAYGEELQIDSSDLAVGLTESFTTTLEGEEQEQKAEQARKLAEEQAKREAELKKLNNAKTSAINYINSGKVRYPKTFTSKQKTKLSTFKTKIKASNSIEKVKSYKVKAVELFKKVKPIYKAKMKFVNSTKYKSKKYSNLLTDSQKKTIQSIINKSYKLTSIKPITKWKSLRDLVVYRAYMSQYISGTENWSKSKLDYVKGWGKRNNKFLNNTPMSGTGYLIARAAYENDMDPRICAAIASVESGCGVAPYGSKYNVWGWVWNPPAMYSWEDGINKWNSYFSSFFGGERYPISSMHGYGGYGPWYVNSIMAKI